MTLAPDEFIRRFLLHVLPDGFHRIRHYGLFASGTRAANIARIRSLLAPTQALREANPELAAAADAPTPACPCCGGRMIIIERFRRGEIPKGAPERDPGRHIMIVAATTRQSASHEASGRICTPGVRFHVFEYLSATAQGGIMASPQRLNWGKLLSASRLPKPKEEAAVDAPEPAGQPWLVNSRTEAERDFDRILFATPTRRLGDKTQVFPLEPNESVRNRLTHSHEVGNLARSIGTHIVHSPLGLRILEEACEALGQDRRAEAARAIPAILGAIGLAHDMGNPPFGHQGEEAIRDWIDHKDPLIFGVGEAETHRAGDEGRKRIIADLERLSVQHREDFRRFEGNAQTIRTLTRLQVVKDNRGLNLTFGTLAALMKYTVASDSVVSKKKGGAAPQRKVGFFASEADLVSQIREATGLRGIIRHPLTHIMEACDDIAYLIVDAEDAVKKELVSFADLLAWLDSRPKLRNDPLAQWVLAAGRRGAAEARTAKLSPSELNDVSMQVFRAHAITAMVSAAINAFNEQYEAIMTTGIEKPLIDLSGADLFASEMKDFDAEHAYRHKAVLRIELGGFNTIQGLLDMLWRGITERESFEDPASPRTSPFARYAYGRISENYRRVFEGNVASTGKDNPHLPVRYRELQLLTDMVAGMTDQYALDLHEELQGFHVGASAPR